MEGMLREPVTYEDENKVVQKNTSYYNLKWSSVKDPSKNNTWNWMAFFLYPFWLPYRKMYIPFIIISLLDLIWMLPAYMIDMPLWLDISFYLAVAIVAGWNGNRWYYKHTQRILKQVKPLTEVQREFFLKTKGGTHIGIMIGLNVLTIAITIGADMGLVYMPTKVNVKDVVRLSIDGDTLETYTDDPQWTYIKKEGRQYVVKFTGYDYSEKEHVRILFNVYLDKQIFEWNKVYIDGKKLNDEELEDYQLWIEDNAWE